MKILGAPCCACGKTIDGIHQVGRMVCTWVPGYGNGEIVGCICRACIKEAEGKYVPRRHLLWNQNG
jgi:hypothetical protein